MSLLVAAALVVLPALSSPVGGKGHPAAGEGGRPERGDSAYHVSAGSSALRYIGGEKVIELSDGVEIVHGDITITSLKGFQYTKRRLTHLRGQVRITEKGLYMEGEEGEYRRMIDRVLLRRNVKIMDRAWEISCGEAVFFRKSGSVWLKGHVVAADSTTTLKADSIYYNRDLLKAEAFGRVIITNLKEGFTVSGRHGFYYRDRREGVMDRDPHLIVDPNSNEPAAVDSDTMRFYPDKRQAVAYGRVKIIKGETVTQCDSAAVFDEEKRAELYGTPLAKEGKTSMQGDSMVLYYDGEEVRRIQIDGSALIREDQADSLVIGRDSWIRGDSMVLYLHRNRVDSIRVMSHCTSEYYPPGEERVESNFIRGDSLLFAFETDTLSYVRITGGSEGVYQYVDLKKGETCDSLRAELDTTLTYLPFDKMAEIVSYSADRIEYFAKRKDMVLRGNSKIHYQNRTLLGEDITYNSTLQLLNARGDPVLIEEQDKFYGNQMDYDLESGVGLVKEGSTKFQQGYYFGRDVAKVADNVLKVWHSTYTTCERKVPHYHFASKEMKVYLKDKVISGPIWLYINNTPIAYLPFMANNIRRGRRSGVLRPEFEFGITKTTGRFIRNFGYYWATNDYTDFKFVGDFNEKSSLRVLVQNRYKLRYRFSGGVNFSFYRDLGSFRNEWTFSSYHRQSLGEKFSLTGDLRFVSSDRAPRAISRIDQVSDVIDRRIESKVTVRKSWNSVGFSASARRVQNLNIQDPEALRVSMTLPSVSLSIPSRNLYFGKERKRGKKTFWEKLLGGIRYSPGLSMSRTTEERPYRHKEVVTQLLSLGFSSPRKLFFLNISPRLSSSNRYTRTVEKVKEHVEITTTSGSQDTTLVPSSRKVESENVFDWSTGGRMSTNFYGTFYPEIGPLKGIRHTISPSLSYSYHPKVGSRPSTQRFNLGLTNSIDLKVGKRDKERKLSGILIWTVGASYNPKAPRKEGWSTVSSRVNLKLFGVNISMNQSMAPYETKILSTQITSSLSLNGTHGFGSSGEAAPIELNVAALDTTQAGERGEVTPEGEREARDVGLPWNVRMALSYSKSQFGPPRSTLNVGAGFQLTRNWKINYTTTYDVESRQFLAQNYSIYRDLHCWEMSFSRQKLGNEWQYYFRINIKAHPEIYAESGRRGLGGRGFGFPSIY